MAYNQFPEHPDDSVGGWMLTFFLLGIPDYRSRTWCLSSVFRLGLRAKVAVI